MADLQSHDNDDDKDVNGGCGHKILHSDVQNAHAGVQQSSRRGRDFSTPSASKIKEVGRGREGQIQVACQGKKILTQSATTEPTLRRFARSIGEIGRSTRSIEIGRFPLLNFVLQSLKTVPEQRVRQKTNRVRTTADCFLLLVVRLHNAAVVQLTS